MRNRLLILIAALALFIGPTGASAQVVDLKTRPGITQRLLTIPSAQPKAAVILFAGGHGGLQISDRGQIKWGEGNFVIRTRQMYADRGFYVVVVDAPSDRLSGNFLGGFRQTQQHVEDMKAVIAWTRSQAEAPVWLIGTSRGTQSAGFLATQLTGSDGPDGLVLTSSILTDTNSRAVPKMELGKIKIPVLVVHHQHDGCSLCAYKDLPPLMDGLTASRRKELFTLNGGQSVGDPCEARAYHGFNGLEAKVVDDIAHWILAVDRSGQH